MWNASNFQLSRDRGERRGQNFFCPTLNRLGQQPKPLLSSKIYSAVQPWLVHSNQQGWPYLTRVCQPCPWLDLLSPKPQPGRTVDVLDHQTIVRDPVFVPNFKAHIVSCVISDQDLYQVYLISGNSNKVKIQPYHIQGWSTIMADQCQHGT